MSDVEHFARVSYVHAKITVDLRFDGLSARLDKAQMWLAEQVLQDCRAVMPLLTGSLQQRSHTEDNGRKVVFPGPYGRYQYMGKVMVDAETGSGPRKIPTGPGGEFVFRYRKGAKLVATERDLKYTNPEARAKWFEVAKARNKDYWVAGFKREIGR